jgi:gamma-glutamyl phosphate reductase
MALSMAANRWAKTPSAFKNIVLAAAWQAIKGKSKNIRTTNRIDLNSAAQLRGVVGSSNCTLTLQRALTLHLDLSSSASRR